MTSAVLIGVGTSLAVGAAAWGLGQLFHHAILRGLRAPRVRHTPPLLALAAPGANLRALRLHGVRGKQLAAWFACPHHHGASGSAPAVLVMHGWGANASMMWPVVQPLLDAGMAVLLLDARCHGDSDDELFTSMPRFTEDIATGLRWLHDEPTVDRERIALLGHSVGAAAALLHASRAGRGVAPGQVAAPRAVVSLSAFAHPQEVMCRLLAEHHVPYPVLGWAVLRHVQHVIGARFDDIAPIHTIRAAPCPVLLVHGRDDTTVPLDDACRLLRAAPHAQLLTVAGGHDLRDALAPHAPEILAFLHRHLHPCPPGVDTLRALDLSVTE